METFTALLLVLLSLALGAMVGSLVTTVRARRKADAAVRANGAPSLGDVVAPVHQAIARLQDDVHRQERDRAVGMGRMEEQLRAMAVGHRDVVRQTHEVVAALRNPGVRGRWGEVQLTRLVEAAGLIEGVSYTVQTGTDGGRLRPDMIVELGAGRTIVIDAKVPLDALLAAHAEHEEPGPAELKDHARAVRARVRDLSDKEYAQQFPTSPDFVVLFLPAEAILSAALIGDPGLIDDAFDRGVLIATPTTLLTLLRTIHLAWQEERAGANAEEILALATEAVDRIGLLAGHLQALGGRLQATVESYNKVAGSWQSRLIPISRRLTEHGLGADPIADLVQNQSDVRRIDRLPEAG